MIFHDVIQNTEDWDNLRMGRLGLSSLKKVMANLGKLDPKGNPSWGNPAIAEAQRIALEQINGEQIESDGYYGEWMADGHTNEIVAKELYEQKRSDDFISVENGGFCQSESLDWFGGSPDGRIPSERANIEIKCVKYTTHIATLKRKSYDPTYKWQLIGNLWLCDIDYIDFIEYCAAFPLGRQLFVDRLLRKDYEKEINQIEVRLGQFEKLIEQQKEIILS